MNSPYNGKFRISQLYRPGKHNGLDLVGVDSKTIHATVAGTVEIAGNNDPKGFGIYVRIKADGTGYRYYYGHMSKTLVKVGDRVVIGQEIGIEGSTGNSTGSHCHYEVRKTTAPDSYLDVCAISGIPNAIGTYDDGYRPAFTAGRVYTLTTNVKVRSGIGTASPQKKKSELTADGQAHALNQDMAVLKAGTAVTVQEVTKISDREYWGKIPSGYIALRYDGEDYVK